MLVWQLAQPSRDSLQQTAGQHIAAASIRSPDKHRRMEKAAGEERCQRQQTTTTKQPHRRQKLRASHEIFNCRPLHQQSAQHDLHAHMLPQLRLSTGKSRSPPNGTDASCIKHSHIKVSAFVSSTSLVQENRIKEKKKSYVWKLYYHHLSKENKGPWQMSDGSNLFLKEYCNITINFSFHPNWGHIFCSERDAYGLVQNCSELALAWDRLF